MKIVTPAEMARLEAMAYAEGSSEEAFMESAGRGVAQVVDRFIKHHRISNQVILLCGKGNNGGDAYVAGIHLLQQGCSIRAYHIGGMDNASALCKKNAERFKAMGGDIIQAVPSAVIFPADGVILDGIFGTGFKGAVGDPYAAIIAAANKSHLPIIAVDIPSGLDGESGVVDTVAIKATMTVFLGLPKRGFFLNSGWEYVGRLVHVDFGLPQKQVDAAQSTMIMFTSEIIKDLLPAIKRSRHKYEAGYVVGIAGSPGMPGAANLSCEAALRGGAGIVRLLYPKGMEAELSSSIFELIKTAYDPEHSLDSVIEAMNKASAVFVGPGIGVNATTRRLLETILPAIEKPCVVDADALTILAEKMIPLPSHTILTPHIGEMRRLLHSEERAPITMAFLQQCHDYAAKAKVTLILKGGPTFVLQEGKSFVVNPYGDPGMATAGSGDVLTGLVAAMLAQGLTTFDAAVLGTYLHAIAGEGAAEEKTSYCMTATDIIRHFPEVFKFERM